MLTQKKSKQIDTAAWQPSDFSIKKSFPEQEFNHWCQRQTKWFEHPLPLQDEQEKYRLLQGGIIKEIYSLQNYRKIISAWVSDSEYPFEHRIDFRIDATLTCLGLVSVHLEASASDTYRLGIECGSPDHYAHLLALLEDENLPTNSLCHWAMRPYYLHFSQSESFTATRLLKLLEKNSTDKLSSIWQELRHRISIKIS